MQGVGLSNNNNAKANDALYKFNKELASCIVRMFGVHASWTLYDNKASHDSWVFEEDTDKVIITDSSGYACFCSINTLCTYMSEYCYIVGFTKKVDSNTKYMILKDRISIDDIPDKEKFSPEGIATTRLMKILNECEGDIDE